jgi:DNA repair exonuclease SbcCD ATPase subunit
MQIVSVVLEDFGAYAGRHEFLVADRGLVLVQGENRDEPRMNSNGAAKSTLFEAIDWALFGLPSKGDHADSVIHEGSTTCAVHVEVKDDSGAVGLVQRQRPSSVAFYVDGVQQTASDGRETQRLINRWLGLDREVFHAAVFFGQEDLERFADSKDAQRMEILSRVIPELGQIDILLERAKDRRKAQTPIKAEAQRVVDSIESQIAALERYDFGESISRWEADRKNRVLGLRNELAAKEKRHMELAPIAVVLPQRQAFLADLERQQKVVMPTTIEGLDAARNSLGYFREQRASLEGAKRQFEAQLAQIKNTGTGRCPACGTIVSQEHLGYETHRLQGEIQSRLQNMSSINDNIALLQREESELLRRLDHAVTEAKQHQQAQMEQISASKIAVQEAMAAQKEVVQIVEAAQALERRIGVEETADNPFLGQKHETEAKLIQLKADWRQAKAIEGEIAVAAQALDFWIDAFGPHGIKSLILDTKLQELTDASNEWVRLLTGGTMWIRFESQRLGRSTKTLRNAPTIRVFRYQPDGRVVERNYRSWSGGEKRRVSWAVDFGLSRLVARRAAKKWDLLVLDEVFKHVDAAGGEAVVEMLTYLQREKSSIFVIEHDSTFQSHFGTVITVKKERGRSRIVEANDGQQEDKGKPQGARDSQEQGRTKEPERGISGSASTKGRKRKRKTHPKNEAHG